MVKWYSKQQRLLEAMLWWEVEPDFPKSWSSLAPVKEKQSLTIHSYINWDSPCQQEQLVSAQRGQDSSPAAKARGKSVSGVA